MNFKRTGWKHLYWQNNGEPDTSRFQEVVPQDALKEHLMGDECPCNPQTELSDPDTGEIWESPIIVHNSYDKRELTEVTQGGE